MRPGLLLFLVLGCSSPAPPAAAQCDPGDPGAEHHGTSCLCCHGDEFGVAGSVDPKGASDLQIRVTDKNGAELVMSPDRYGNFFRHFQPAAPLRPKIIGPSGERVMLGEAPSGDCNSCHRAGGTGEPL